MHNPTNSQVFKNLFDTLEFNDEARREATSALFKISQKFGLQCCAINHAVKRTAKRIKDTITFFAKDAQAPHLFHKKPLYVEAKINKLLLKHALIDSGSSINLMP